MKAEVEPMNGHQDELSTLQQLGPARSMAAAEHPIRNVVYCRRCTGGGRQVSEGCRDE